MLSPPAQLEVDEFPHHKSLSDADGSQNSDPNKKHVEVPSGQVQALVLSVGKAKAHGEDRQGQGEQPPKDKQDRPNGEPCLSVLIAEVNQAGHVEEQLHKVMQDQQDQTQTVQVEDVSSSNVEQVERDVDKLTWDILLLGLLEVEFRESMEPVAQLTNEVKLHLEWHEGVRISLPQSDWLGQEVLRE